MQNVERKSAAECPSEGWSCACSWPSVRGSEIPAQTNIDDICVDANGNGGAINVGIGDVNEAVLQCQRQVILEKMVAARAGLDSGLVSYVGESSAQSGASPALLGQATSRQTNAQESSAFSIVGRASD